MSNVAGKAYGMNVITPMKPWLTWVNVFFFRVGRVVSETLGGLLGLSLIHFARWVMIKRKQWPDLGQGPQTLQNDYMLFCSNFNGTWDQYIDAFSDGIPAGLDLFWYASTKYPYSIPITPFKDYILHNQIDTNYYYNATPGAAQRDIKSALKLYPDLRALAEEHPKLSPVDFATAYRATLLNIQGNLPSSGYAPVASTDTWEADWNRAQFIHGAQNAMQAAPAPPPQAVATSLPPVTRHATTTSFDGGHYSLTVLVPIQNTQLVEYLGVQRSAVQRLRAVLSTLPTARQSRATEALGLDSPFSRNAHTHLARFVVIDDVQYNGREPECILKKALQGTAALITPQPQDRLNCPYLLFAVDFDAKDGDSATVRGYLMELWQSMRPELCAVFENCFGFERVSDAASFSDYIMACEIETTMPFNDYWPGKPLLTDKVVEASIPALLVIVACIALWRVYDLSWLSGFGLPLLLAVLATLYAIYWGVIKVGGMPFGTAPYSDLPSVLKALYLQRHFIDLMIDTQGANAADLHARFGAFLAAHQPLSPTPTQAPGVIA